MEIIINQDIRKVKTKDLGMFSFKEAGFLAVSVGIGAGIFVLEKKVFKFEEVQYYLIIIPMMIPLVFGFLKPFGMSFWTFCKTYINETFIKPPIYNDIYESLDDIELDYESLIEEYGEEYFMETPDFLSDFKIDKTSPDFKADAKKYHKNLL